MGFFSDQAHPEFSDGEDLNLDGIIYLIGVQELGQGKRRFKKDEKNESDAYCHLPIARTFWILYVLVF